MTGAEVLYADIGHFGKSPIRAVWFSLVYPALLLNYLGQGAHLLHHPAAADNLFYQLAPSWFLVPAIVVATAATIIASQAVITGMFSLAKQAVQLGFWPRVKIIYTSPDNPGRVYIPFVNTVLFISTVMFVLYFKKSGNLASAYGIAVSATMLITTALIFIIARTLWPRLHPVILLPLFWGFLVLHTVLFLANVTKLSSGGWVVVFISVIFVVLMTSWVRGRTLLGRKIAVESLSFDLFVADITEKKPPRVAGTAVFLTGSAASTPRALLHNFKHNQALHERIIALSVLNEEIPFVADENRFSLANLGAGVYRICISFGFMETPDITRHLGAIEIDGRRLDPHQVSYFLGKELLVLTGTGGMMAWRKRIFMFLSRNSLNASAFFRLPPNRVVEFGSQVEL